MSEVEASDAQNDMGALLDLVEHGEEVVITRNGRPIAQLVKEVGYVDLDRSRRAAARIRDLARSKAWQLRLARMEGPPRSVASVSWFCWVSR